MARSISDYQSALTNALPQGAAFPREDTPNRDGLFASIAQELSSEGEAIDRLLVEADPRTTNRLLIEWERDYGLPDCEHGNALTLQERKAILNEKINRIGSLNINAIKAIANQLGYQVSVTERRPFVGGISGGGDRASGPHSARYWWSVAVHEPRVTYFRGGQSRGSEKLLTIRKAEDLECMLHRINHSDTKLIIGYEGN
ncbi:putative phage tail protein [Kiloniella majae]|uniref:putative phage tail protein n=1 Tax=Kiloniella majae TaxID=1938558 RepID=UPI000A276D7D|nr:putative phage tail protein [Kiloniella majae]